MSGRLFIVSTPIGNLGDISPRVKHALTESAIVLAEDTRVSQKLLFHLGVQARLLSCHEHNELQRLTVLEEANSVGGAVALLCDAGTPLVSDPGYKIVGKAIELGMQVIPIPGPAALLTALVGSGLPCDRFSFEGFLPAKSSERKRRLEKCALDDRTLLFYVAPSNLLDVLNDMQASFGSRKACLARELTKFYEQFVRATLPELIEHVQVNGTRGEYVVVVAGCDSEQNTLGQEEVKERLRELLAAGGKLKEVASILAPETGWSSSQIYKLGLSIKEGTQSCP